MPQRRRCSPQRTVLQSQFEKVIDNIRLLAGIPGRKAIVGVGVFTDSATSDQIKPAAELVKSLGARTTFSIDLIMTVPTQPKLSGKQPTTMGSLTSLYARRGPNTRL